MNLEKTIKENVDKSQVQTINLETLDLKDSKDKVVRKEKIKLKVTPKTPVIG